MLINIPTEMLRTLVAVVDHKSFTKAAMALGVTQPAVSAQIKRLQIVLGTNVFAKDVAGIVLTPTGDAVVTYARRLLSINDQIVRMAAREPSEVTIKIGITGDFFSAAIPKGLGNFRKKWPNRNFKLHLGTNVELLQQLRAGDLDLVVSFTPEKPERDARYHWTEELIWVRGATLPEPLPDVVPLVVRADHWMNHGLAIAALEKIGRPYDFAFTAPSVRSLMSAVGAGFGVMPFTKNRLQGTELVPAKDPSLPKLPDVVCSICVRESADNKMLDELAVAIANVIRQYPNSDPVAVPFELAKAHG